MTGSMIGVIVTSSFISLLAILNVFNYRRKMEELEDQNKFLHDQYIKIKNENEELKKKMDPKYQVRKFSAQKKIKRKPQPKPQPEYTYEYNNGSGDRYDYVEVKSMRDMYDYKSK